MSKGIILGIDFSSDYTQLAFLDADNNPQSVCIGTEDNYLIPSVVCYSKELCEWSAGDEAVNKGRLSNSILYNNLPQMCNEEMSEDDREVIKNFFSHLIKLTVNFCNGSLIRNVLVSVDDLNPMVIENLMDILIELGYDEESIKVISHTESFVYYVLNQNKDIWINKVYLLHLNNKDFSCRKLNVMKGREPFVADVTYENIDFIINNIKEKSPFSGEVMTKDTAEKLDEDLSDYMEEQLGKNVVSGIYLSGQGFYESDWNKTISTICGNRRVFKGNNLIVKGAAYGAREFFYTPQLDSFLISCKGRTRVKITMDVKYKERDNTITLSNIGDYWYNARSKAECIMEEPTEATFDIHDVINHTSDKFKIDLTEFPKRPEKTTRIEVNFRYLEENKFEIEIKDLGFGEFFKSSGMSVKKEVVI